jgi:uncharacterized membrane protein
MNIEVTFPQILYCMMRDVSVTDVASGEPIGSSFVAIVLPFIVLTAFVIALTYWNAASQRRFIRATRGIYFLTPLPLLTATMVLGMGLGGLIDGIVFHQILQWHTMLSNKLPNITPENKAVNTFWDGILFSYTLILVIVGIAMLWRAAGRPEAHRSPNLFAAGLLMGWGLFNVVEGIIDHHLLKLHNVSEVSNQWNELFLGFSFGLIAIGMFFLRFVQRKMFIKSWK